MGPSRKLTSHDHTGARLVGAHLHVLSISSVMNDLTPRRNHLSVPNALVASRAEIYYYDTSRNYT
jgi:hypothetical protein